MVHGENLRNVTVSNFARRIHGRIKREKSGEHVCVCELKPTGHATLLSFDRSIHPYSWMCLLCAYFVPAGRCMCSTFPLLVLSPGERRGSHVTRRGIINPSVSLAGAPVPHAYSSFVNINFSIFLEKTEFY